MKRLRIVAALVGVVILVAAVTVTYSATAAHQCPSSSGTEASSSGPKGGITSTLDNGTDLHSSASPIRHIIMILMENESCFGVLGNQAAPYETALASEYAVARVYAVSHPSLPNYLALVGGNTFGITTDCNPDECSLTNTSIADLLQSHGLSWKEYAESMPTNCSQSDSPDGLYSPKHNPFVYFTSVSGNAGSGPTSQYCDSHVVPFTQFSNDLGRDQLPSYSFITPNLCDDAHSCPLSTADSWLSKVISGVMNSSSYSSSAVFIVYDEGEGSTPGTPSLVTCILVSPFAKHGFLSHAYYTHYSILATVEWMLGLGNLGRNDATSGVMSDMFSVNVS